MTRQKISQTWLASQTGRERDVDEVTRTPAALRAAGGQVPEPGAEVGTAEDGVGDHADEEQHRRDGAHRLSPPAVPTPRSRAFDGP